MSNFIYFSGKYLVATRDHKVTISDDDKDGIVWTNTYSMFLSCKVRFENVQLVAKKSEDQNKDGESLEVRVITDKGRKDSTIHSRLRLMLIG